MNNTDLFKFEQDTAGDCSWIFEEQSELPGGTTLTIYTYRDSLKWDIEESGPRRHVGLSLSSVIPGFNYLIKNQPYGWFLIIFALLVALYLMNALVRTLTRQLFMVDLVPYNNSGGPTSEMISIDVFKKELEKHYAFQAEQNSKNVDESLLFIIKVVAEECWMNADLRRIGKRIGKQEEFKDLVIRIESTKPEDSQATHEDLSKKLVIDHITEAARSHYAHMWSQLNVNEKVVLYHVAIHGYASWQSRQVVSNLLKKKHVVIAPILRPINSSFKNFVQQAEPYETIKTWRKAGVESTWSRLRGSIIVILGTLLVFFFVAQPNFFHQSLALITALAAGLPAIVHFISFLSRWSVPLESRTNM